MDAQRIRATFTDFFVQRDHLRVASAPLIAPGDPTLLFTSAGMVPFKPFFAGEAQPPHHRLTSIQKCFRTTDIDEVGDASHLTMFEMLGNFSLGDYFKAEAQAWAWELVTGVLQIPPERLVATVFTDDDFAYGQWRRIGLPDSKIFRYGEDQGNFWAAGPEGPCGPCSELHYDMRPDPRAPNAGPADDEERFLEIWNLVFMQYNRQPDGSLVDLPAQSIDTGAGLERWAMMLQEKSNLYDTDLFAPLLDFVGERCSLEYAGASDAQRRAMRVVAEHGRAMTFLIADGALPANEGRGYVLRRLIRRALYHADTLGIDEPLLSGVAAQIRTGMGAWYPEIIDQAALVDRVLDQEEDRFRQTLSSGRALLEEQTIPIKRAMQAVIQEFELRDDDPAKWDLAALSQSLLGAATAIPQRNQGLWGAAVADTAGRANVALNKVIQEHGHPSMTDPVSVIRAIKESTSRISGQEVFILYDTFGLPREVTAEVARLADLSVDDAGFDEALDQQRERSREKSTFDQDVDAEVFAELEVATTFSGYEQAAATSTIAAIVRERELVGRAQAGDRVSVVLHETPFYPEGGGQVGDAGLIRTEAAQLDVTDTRAWGDVIAHVGTISAGELSVGDAVEAVVDRSRRADTTRNHTATHLLHAALRQVLGDHVRQAGSLVAPDHLRFDYTQSEAPTAEQLREVQRVVRARIRDDLPVETLELPYEQALQRGAMAIFGEKYATEVRVVEICDPAPHIHDCFSKELCGGTHAPATGFVGDFQIISEGSVGAGQRRIEALTGAAAEAWVERRLATLDGVSSSLRATPDTLPDRIGQMRAELQELRRRLAAVEAQTGASVAEQLAANPADVEGVALVAGRVEVESASALRSAGDEVRRRLDEAVIVLGTVAGERPLFVAMVTPGLVERGLHAGKLIGGIARIAGGGGGGKPEMAQAGGRDAGQLGAALAAAPDAVRAQLADA